MVTALDLLAHHEAGHATIAHSFGLPLRAVRIRLEDQSGQTELREGVKPSRLQHAIVLLAGGRAEKVLDPTSLYKERLSAARDESQFATLVSERLDAKLIHRPFEYVDALGEKMDERIAACCERLVRHQWQKITRLAAALSLRNELSGPEAEALLSSAKDSR